MNVLAIGAHPDDIEITCPARAKYKKSHNVTVCHVANGDMGHAVIKPDELRKIRIKKLKMRQACRNPCCNVRYWRPDGI